MKKWSFILLITAILMTSAGCGSSKSSDNATADDSLQKVLDAGVLRVGAEGNWVPFVYNDPDDEGKLKGFEVEMAEEVARRMGVSVEWSISNKWDGVIAGLQANRYDAIFCGITKDNLESAEKTIGTIPYNESNIVLVVAEDNKEINGWEDLNGKLSGNALTGDFGAIVKSYGAELTDASLEQSMELLEQHRIDCHVNSQIAIENYIEKKPNTAVKVIAMYEPEDQESLYNYAMLNDNAVALRDAIDGHIADMLEDGTCYNLAEKYFGSTIADSISLYK